jgi:HK97 gp10 family phage protein
MAVMILGLKECLAKLALLPAVVDKAADVGKRKGAARIAAKAQANVEVRTGHTRSTIVVTPEGNVSAGGAAIYLERGTSKMPAEPFLGPAAESEQAGVADDVASAVRVVVVAL